MEQAGLEPGPMEQVQMGELHISNEQEWEDNGGEKEKKWEKDKRGCPPPNMLGSQGPLVIGQCPLSCSYQQA